MTEKHGDVALWRYGIIAPLLHLIPGENQQGHVLFKLSQQDWIHPHGQSLRLSQETLRKWLYRYRHGGLPALANQKRSDYGRSNIPEKVIDQLFSLRQQHPRWTLQRMLDELIKQGNWNGRKPSRSAFYRFAKNHQLGRDPHLTPTACRSFAYGGFGQLWMADFLHGPKLRDHGRKRKTYLHAIVDDCSRYVVASAFSFAETIETMMGDLMKASRRFGLPQRFYTDNGACYKSRHLKLVCARIGVQMIHTPPGKPRGRGKVERFFRTVRDQFLSEQRYSSLEQMNQHYQQWLARYHESLHSSLQATPLQTRLRVENHCRTLPEVVEIDALFRMERRCRVYNNGTVRLLGRSYEVPGCLPKSRVTVYYLPWDLSQIFYGEDLIPAKPLNTTANAHRFNHPKGGSHDPHHA